MDDDADANTDDRKNSAISPCYRRFSYISFPFVYSSIVDRRSGSGHGMRRRAIERQLLISTSLSLPCDIDLAGRRTTHYRSTTRRINFAWMSICRHPSRTQANPSSNASSASSARSRCGAFSQNVCGHPSTTSTFTRTPPSCNSFA